MNRRVFLAICVAALVVANTACQRTENSSNGGLQETSGITVTGIVTDPSGHPIGGARVAIATGAEKEPISISEVGDDGTYRHTLTGDGYREIRFQDKGRDIRTIPFWIESGEEETIELDICMDDYQYTEKPMVVMAVGDFNDFDMRSAVALENLGDGIWSVEIASDAEHVEYQLLGLHAFSGDPLPGNRRDAIRYRSDHGWVGVATVVEGRATITTSVVKGHHAVCESPFVFGEPSSRYAVLAGVNNEFKNAWNETIRELRKLADPKTDGPPILKKFVSETLNPLYLELQQNLTEDRHRDYLALLYLGNNPFYEEDLVVVEGAFDLLEPTSGVLAALSRESRMLLFRGMEQWPERTADFFKNALNEHEDAYLKSKILETWVNLAKHAGDEDKAKALMKRLLAEYPESKSATLIRKQWGDLSPIPIGAPAPDFEVASLFEPHTTYTRADLEGGPYLVDFWATWCGPCIKEIPNIQKAHERFADRGFKVLSVSLDFDRGKPEAFVGTKFEMPWLHAADPKAMTSEVAITFGVTSLPSPILVDSEGIIVAKGFELYGDRLEQQLEKLFAEPSDEP